ncbi:MAG: TetR family transcriptional regulator [Labilithrix sp.]|nr:TetR family transcriptional regulator [Labilithrix sp.]
MERILEAAAQVFAADGYEVATMDAIAARAETSIGSIYQFYPNKAAVFDALVRRHHDGIRVFFDGLFAGPLLEGSWRSLLDSGIDAIAALHRADAGFRAVFRGLHFTKAMLDEGEALNRELAERVAVVFEQKLPALPAPRRAFVAMMVVELVSAMLILSARRPDEASAVMAETKALLRLYLAPYDDGGAKGSATGRSTLRSRR